MVTRIQDPEEGVQRLALETLKTEIKSATASMTAVPKPLKFLRVHYDHLKTVFENFPEGENKVRLAACLLYTPFHTHTNDHLSAFWPDDPTSVPREKGGGVSWAAFN